MQLKQYKFRNFYCLNRDLKNKVQNYTGLYNIKMASYNVIKI